VNELQRYLVKEAVEDYEEGRLTRRDALKAIAGLTGARYDAAAAKGAWGETLAWFGKHLA
jgi:dienelactone hydrolase